MFHGSHVITLTLQYTFVKLEVIGEEVVVTQYPSCLHGRLFHNFIPLMGLGECEFTALRVDYTYYY